MYCNSSVLRYSFWCTNGNSRPNNSENDENSLEYVRNCKSNLCESKLVKFMVFGPKSEKRTTVKKLEWLVHLIKMEGINTLKTIAFCNTVNELPLL